MIYFSSGLNSCEKELLTNLLRDDVGIATSEYTSGIRLSWQQVGQAFTDGRVYLYVLIGACNFGVLKCLLTYVPLFIQATDRPPGLSVHFVTAPIYAVACVFCLLVGYSSSRRKEISFHIIFCQLLSVVGFILMLTLRDRGSVVLIISTCIVCCGEFAISPLILSWITNNVIGHTKRSIVVSLVLAIGQAPGIFAPQVRELLLLKTWRSIRLAVLLYSMFIYTSFKVYPDADQPAYQRGHWICITSTMIGLVLTVILRFCLMFENHRRDNLSLDQRQLAITMKEPCDLVS